MWRLSVFVLCLCGCGYIGYDSVAAPLTEAGVDASVDGATDGGEVTCALTSPASFCTSLPQMTRAPVLDGVVDCGLVPRAFAPEGWYPTGSVGMPSGMNTRFAAAWRSDGIYVYFEVDDPSLYPAPIVDGLLYCGDSAEIYLDTDGTYTSAPAYDAQGTRQFLARVPPMGSTVEHTGEVFKQQVRQAGWNPASFGIWTRPGGYVLEAFLTSAEIGVATTFTSGGRIGLDLGVNVSTPDGSASECGMRIGQFFLRNGTSMADPCYGRPYCDVNAFCTPQLSP